MKKKNLIIISLIVLAVIVLLLFLVKNNDNNTVNNDVSSGFRIGSNAVYVAEQLPGESLTASIVVVDKPSFLVIHEDNNGSPGKIIGSSNLISVGETKGLVISLSRNTVDGEKLYAMIHVDNGNGTFNGQEDSPAIDSTANEPVMMIVPVSKDASEPGEVII